MSCNPAIGGIGKGHLCREIDALGGAMARAIDRAGIQFRTLNASKGPAVRATRAQADRVLYRAGHPRDARGQPNLEMSAGRSMISRSSSDRVQGVVTDGGVRFRAAAVVLTVGTFLGGRIHIGREYKGGCAGDAPSNRLARRLRELPFRVGRLKTGTPPRLDGRTLDYSVMQAQPGDAPVPVFSFLGRRAEHPRQVACHITHTNEHDARHHSRRADRSPMYTGRHRGRGSALLSLDRGQGRALRRQRDSHQVFVEPEGLDTQEVYPNGISTSLPADVQAGFVRSMPGFERARITQPGYAIEYDYFDPRDLMPTLETRHLGGLFFAGQINGTTGYEEAGAQGLSPGSTRHGRRLAATAGSRAATTPTSAYSSTT